MQQMDRHFTGTAKLRSAASCPSPRRRWLPALAGALLAACLAPAPAGADDAQEILLNSLQPRDTTYVGEQVSEGGRRHHGPGDRGRGPRLRQQVYRKDNVLCIRYEDGGVVFDDGKKAQIYNPRANTVERMPSNLDPGVIERRRQMLKNARSPVEQLPDERVAGRSAYVLSVKGEHGTRKFWIDRQTYLLLRHEDTRPEGHTRSTYYTRIDFDAVPTAEQLSFNPPPGVQFVEGGRRPLRPEHAAQMARAWGGLLRPGALPAGYQLRGYFRHFFEGQPALATVFGLPGQKKSLTMFQGPSRGTGRMMQRQRDNLTVLAGRKGGADVVLVGPFSEDELQKILDSVTVQP